MDARTKAFAIVNPVAGNGAGARIASGLARELARAGLDIEMAVCPARGGAARLAAGAVEDGYRTIVAVGGDGTANEVANGLVGSDAVLALYPIGTGNDFARGLGYPRNGRGALAEWLASVARPRRIDVGEVNGRIFLNATGVGIDGHIAEHVSSASPLGYLLASLGGIATYRPQPMEVRIDGRALRGRFLTVIASNGRFFGGGMRPAPRARLDDGLLDVTVAGDLSRVASVVALMRIYFGRHENGTTITTRTARSVEIELERPLAYQLDGEPSRADRLVIGVRPSALAVLAAP